MIDLEESYYTLKNFGLVSDCDYGIGEAYVFEHKDKVFAFTYYESTNAVSLLDVTNDPSYLDKEQAA